MIDFNRPANRKLIEYLQSCNSHRHSPEQNPAGIDLRSSTLGTHPDILERLWGELGGVLPVKCNWILYGRPVLAHPRTGIVFGFAGGSLTYALRLPPEVRRAAIAAGAATRHDYPAYPQLQVSASSLDLEVFGPQWVFGAWLRDEPQWSVAAFAHAAESDLEIEQ